MKAKFRSINFGFNIKPILTSYNRIQVLVNATPIQCVLITDSKILMEYNYETGFISSKLAISDLSEAKPPLSGCYSGKFDIYLVLFDNWKLYAFMRNLSVL